MLKQFVKALQACHEDHPYSKFWGKCNACKVDIDNCFREEKQQRYKANLALSRKRDAAWEQAKLQAAQERGEVPSS
jgi:Cytochrome c oxidase biogenesis protein Cmc1 like